LNLKLISSNKIIKNINFPSCKNCIYYKPNRYNNDFTSLLNKCENFGEKNIITDEITYNYADSCRSDENKCGKEGKYFIEEKNINFKIFSYKFVSNFPNYFFILSIFYLFITIFIKFIPLIK
jgi:hypothetical protein